MAVEKPSVTIRNRNQDIWIEAGYKLYAEEGLAGIQIERLARMLQLNKSSFYHYFGDLDGFYNELINLHKKIADDFLREVAEIKTLDPDYFHLVVRYKVAVMFQMQTVRDKNNKAFCEIAEQLDKRKDVILKLWSEYLGLQVTPQLAMRYFDIVRDVFYTRITFEEFDYDYLKKLVTEAKEVMQQLAEEPDKRLN